MATDSVTRRDMLALGTAMLAAESASAATSPGAEHEVKPDSSHAPTPLIDRAFVRLQEGLVHYRSVGSPAHRGAMPLYLAHAGPGSSRSFEGMLPALGTRRYCVAPDMLGNGDSAPPASESTDIGYYVDCALRVMDALHLDKVDFYGSHTGAQIGCELAVRHPGRIRRLVLDGVPLFTDAFKARLLANYAPRVTPDDYGGHLTWAWNFVRDQSLYWPYFDRQAANRLANGVLSAAELHRGVTDVLKALDTYHVAYHAAFRQDLRALLPQLRTAVLLIASERDPLSAYLDEASGLVPHAEKRLLPRSASAQDRVDAVERFLA